MMIDESKQNVERVEYVVKLSEVFDNKSFDEVVKVLREYYECVENFEDYQVKKILFFTEVEEWSGVVDVTIKGYGPETDEEQEARIRKHRQIMERQQKKLKMQEEREREEYNRLKAKFEECRPNEKLRVSDERKA